MTSCTDKEWESRLDGRWSTWLMGLEFHYSDPDHPLLGQREVVSPLMQQVEMVLFPWDFSDEDFDETKCPLVVRLESERQETTTEKERKMPKTKVEFSEAEVKAALSDEIRKKYKLKKDTIIRVELFIDRPDGESPVITCGATFDAE